MAHSLKYPNFVLLKMFYMRKHYFTLVFLLFFNTTFAQNLIKNPGFEDAECAAAQGKGGIWIKKGNQYCKIKDWEYATQAKTDFAISDTGNKARSGNYILGFNAYGTGKYAYRDYLEGTLEKPLTEGRTYQFRMAVKVSKRSSLLSNNFGAYFSPTKVFMASTGSIPFRPQVSNKLPMKDWLAALKLKNREALVNWSDENSFILEGSFVATGNEKFIVIGNFDPDKSTTTVELFPSDKVKNQSFYLIDDLSLEEDLSIPLTQVKKSFVNKKDIKPGAVLPVKNLNFEQNSARLKPGAEQSLSQLVELLNDNPKIELEIGGHNDLTGKESHKLSEDRAMIVYNFLINSGIPQKRLTYKGYGTDKPVTFYFKGEEQGKNRRVECKVTRM